MYQKKLFETNFANAYTNDANWEGCNLDAVSRVTYGILELFEKLSNVTQFTISRFSRNKAEQSLSAPHPGYGALYRARQKNGSQVVRIFQARPGRSGKQQKILATWEPFFCRAL